MRRRGYEQFRWDDKSDAELRRLFLQGLPASIIARRLGTHPHNVGERLRVLGLKE